MVLSFQRERDVYGQVLVVAVVLMLHAAVLAWWLAQPSAAELVVEREMSVALVEAPRAQAGVEPAPPPAEETRPAEPLRRPQPAPVKAEQAVKPPPDMQPKQAQSSAPAMPVAAAPVVRPGTMLPDVEPDYRATYLHNPRPRYPGRARRLGLQGRVVLNVEVLSKGLCGQVLVRQSSGYDMLDNAARDAVKRWRFVPAQHAGQAVTRWFLIPIQFRLEDSEV